MLILVYIPYEIKVWLFKKIPALCDAVSAPEVILHKIHRKYYFDGYPAMNKRRGNYGEIDSPLNRDCQKIRCKERLQLLLTDP